MRLLSLILAALLLFPVSASAEDNTQGLMGYTETEKVGFAFYHLINKDPNYQELIMARPDYKHAKPAEKMEIMDDNNLRLREGFANFVLDRDLIILKMPLFFTTMNNPDYRTDMNAISKRLTKRIQITTGPTTGMLYFPFQVGKMTIGLIPNDFERFAKVDMTDEEFKDFCTPLGACKFGLKDYAFNTVIVLKPIQADDKNPMVDGDLPIFLMMSEVASIRLDTGFNDGVWSYTAPWYFNSKSKELMVLHK